MKNIKTFGVFAVGLAVTLSAMAANDWSVSTVTGFTNALAKAGWYDTITLAVGEYDLTGVGNATAHCSNMKGLLIRGADATSWRDRVDRLTAVVLKGDGTKPIFQTNQNSAFWTAKRGSTFHNLTFKNAASSGAGGAIKNVDSASMSGGNYVLCSNCVFVSCQATGNGGALNVAKTYDCRFSACKTTGNFGGAQAFGEATDSLFEDNYAGHSGGALAYATARNCTFTGNSAKYWAGAAFNTSLYDCTLTGNKTSEQYGGAAVPDGSTIVFSGCTFTGNSAAASMGGAISTRPDTRASAKLALVTNCTFVANKAQSGGALYCMQNVVNCTFANNTNTYYSGHCWHCKVRDSRITGDGQMCQTELKNCVFYAARSVNDSSRGLVVSHVNGAGDVESKAINCLFTNITNQLVFDCQGQSMSIVNCTVADSTVEGAPVRLTTYTTTTSANVKILNSIFANIKCGGIDRGFWLAREVFDGSCVFSNNLATAMTVPDSIQSFTVAAGNNEQADPKFLGAGNRYGAPAYMTRYSSKAHEAGLVVADRTEKDIAGNPRLINGKIDLGCYETCYDRFGLILVVR